MPHCYFAINTTGREYARLIADYIFCSIREFTMLESEFLVFGRLDAAGFADSPRRLALARANRP